MNQELIEKAKELIDRYVNLDHLDEGEMESLLDDAMIIVTEVSNMNPEIR